MSKRSLFILSFLFVFTFFGTIGTISELNAKSQSKIEDLNQSKKKKNTKKKNTKKKSNKKKKTSSGKKKSSKKNTNKKKSSKKKKGKNYSSKKKKGKKYSSKKKKRNYNTSRTYNTGTYTPPKTYDSGSDGSREYKRSEDKPVENFRKEPKKDGE
ncbi:MAG TPA: hypothetical protein PK536_12680 [Ignavibacteria bacterium]|nr:hypothetical protein [Ignavibacteria bacterium]HRJ98119.1 hypothetical protein [Ignavibacteria bacterium]